jgi:hypothetical protein
MPGTMRLSVPLELREKQQSPTRSNDDGANPTAQHTATATNYKYQVGLREEGGEVRRERSGSLFELRRSDSDNNSSYYQAVRLGSIPAEHPKGQLSRQPATSGVHDSGLQSDMQQVLSKMIASDPPGRLSPALASCRPPPLCSLGVGTWGSAVPNGPHKQLHSNCCLTTCW